jgi:hypothetical protein
MLVPGFSRRYHDTLSAEAFCGSGHQLLTQKRPALQPAGSGFWDQVVVCSGKWVNLLPLKSRISDYNPALA